MKITQSILRKLIAEELEARETALINEVAEWVQPLLVMVAPLLGYHLYGWFAKQGESEEPKPFRHKDRYIPEGQLKEGMKMPDVPQELIDQIPNDPVKIKDALAQELNLSAQGLKEFTEMIQQLIANR